MLLRRARALSLHFSFTEVFAERGCGHARAHGAGFAAATGGTTSIMKQRGVCTPRRLACSYSGARACAPVTGLRPPPSWHGAVLSAVHSCA
jgi:hypothetical protein